MLRGDERRRSRASPHQTIESGNWQLRYPSGPDAAGFLSWRAAMTDEQWVAWSAQDDESWYAQVERDFGLNARPATRTAGRKNP